MIVIAIKAIFSIGEWSGQFELKRDAWTKNELDADVLIIGDFSKDWGEDGVFLSVQILKIPMNKYGSYEEISESRTINKKKSLDWYQSYFFI